MPGWRGNPYVEFGPRPFREARLRAYVVRQHRCGRPLREILNDPYVARCGGESLRWTVLEDPRTIDALRRNDREAFAEVAAAVAHHSRDAASSES